MAIQTYEVYKSLIANGMTPEKADVEARLCSLEALCRGILGNMNGGFSKIDKEFSKIDETFSKIDKHFIHIKYWFILLTFLVISPPISDIAPFIKGFIK